MSDRLWNIFACEVPAKKAITLQKLITSRKPVDAEYIHDVRVAARRLKEALRAFGASTEPANVPEWKKTIKTMLTALGYARDAQVQLGILVEFLYRHKTLKEDAGLTGLAADLTKRRRKLDREARKAIEAFEKTEVLRQISSLRRNQVYSNGGGIEKPQASQLYPQISPTIARRMAGVKKYGKFAGRPHCQKELHQLRLAIKKLRYTLELFAPLYGDTLDASIETAAALQQALGSMHDNTVWLDNLTAEISERATTKGMQNFYREQKVARRYHYKNFLTIWTRAKNQNIWAEMQQAISAKYNNAGKK